MGDLKAVRQLLDGGMDVNVPAWGSKAQGAIRLHLAAQGGHCKVMEELLERGADVEARTKGACGWTPLHVAAKERNKEAVKFLVENGAFLPADLNDSRFNPPLHYCPGLEWAYGVKRLQDENLSAGDGFFLLLSLYSFLCVFYSHAETNPCQRLVAPLECAWMSEDTSYNQCDEHTSVGEHGCKPSSDDLIDLVRAFVLRLEC